MITRISRNSTINNCSKILWCNGAQLAYRDAQLEQVRAERNNHFVQEEEVLAHMRLLSKKLKIGNPG